MQGGINRKMTDRIKKHIDWFDIYLIGFLVVCYTLPFIEGYITHQRELKEQRRVEVETKTRNQRLETLRTLDLIDFWSDVNHDGKLEGKEIDFYRKEIEVNGLNKLSFR